ncbi:cell division protein FtsI/penicillin-binding protein 2 [Symbiobacterium terraclitae]|uniref:Cell division protein FtsI/penicillin-binding protein 2 n=1 Tax=Symbiobacterium terraclitae TaxID=557451 RepID=A0ABS4JTM6_9FIRM|nr:penicillin-binding protein 2 [Symbiobacterium terraclitae]MBP2018300.1 cell division protein FtsI/penicillin-binding protein 2 [Symbiobacterium terraclitae]
MRRRTKFLRTVLLALLLAMIGRLAWFQLVRADEVLAREEARRLQEASYKPVRGALVDRSGRPLAVSIPQRDVVASPFHMEAKNFASVAAALAPLLGADAASLERRLAENADSQYLVLARGVDLATAEAIRKERLPGIALVESSERIYPQGDVANQIIGYLDDRGVGIYGLEAQYEEHLRGVEGFVRAEMTYDNAPIAGTVKSNTPAQDGLTAVLTLDAYLQRVFEEALDEVIAQEDAKRALAIAMDVHTGEILAMAMRPGANLSDRDTWLKPDGTLDAERITNWAVTPLPPGSSFKTVTTAIALEEGLLDLDTLIPDSGQLEIDGWTIWNWDRSVPVEPRLMTIAELLQTSSNVGLIQVGQRIPHETFQRYVQAFGFTEPTGLDFPHESAATGLAGWEEKRAIDWANMYIGQHLEVTPLQMVRAAAVFANGGRLVRPHLVRELRDADGNVVWTATTEPLRTVISEQTAAEVRELMVSVIEKAYHQARVPGYTAGGKTGTAQKFEGGVEKERGLGDFLGFAPASDPRVAMFVLIDEPKPPGYGGTIAAPLFAKLMPIVLRTLGVPPDNPVAETAAEPAAPQAEDKEKAKVAVPDARYLPVGWAAQRLADAGLRPRLSGEGAVVAAQSLAPGSQAEPGSEVELTLAPLVPAEVMLPDFRGLTLADASRLAAELGLSLKQAGGAGFVAEQSPAVGTPVEAGSVVTLRLSTVRP